MWWVQQKRLIATQVDEGCRASFEARPTACNEMDGAKSRELGARFS